MLRDRDRSLSAHAGELEMHGPGDTLTAAQCLALSVLAGTGHGTSVDPADRPATEAQTHSGFARAHGCPPMIYTPVPNVAAGGTARSHCVLATSDRFADRARTVLWVGFCQSPSLLRRAAPSLNQTFTAHLSKTATDADLFFCQVNSCLFFFVYYD